MIAKDRIIEVMNLSDDQIIDELNSIFVSDEEIDKRMEEIRASLPVAIGTGGTGAYCCGAGGPNNTECTTTSPNDICNPALPACA